MTKKHGVPHPEWLALSSEQAIDPSAPIIDTQHHVWQGKRGFPYLMEDLAADVVSGHNVLATVFVTSTTHYRGAGPEHLKSVGEIEWLMRQVDDHARAHPGGPDYCAGIVAGMDFRFDPGLVDEGLKAQKAASHRVRGIRQGATWSDDAQVNDGRPPAVRHLYLDPGFRKGFARLAQNGMSFDAYVFHDQMDELADLARAFPDTPIVCNHICPPLAQGRWASRQDEVRQAWKKGLVDLARWPNVHMKLGGCAMPMFAFHWDDLPQPPSSDRMLEDSGPLYHQVIEAFSPSRCMFESNFPVDKQGCGYVALWNSFKKIASRYSSAERAELLCNTARRFYRLDSVKVPA